MWTVRSLPLTFAFPVFLQELIPQIVAKEKIVHTLPRHVDIKQLRVAIGPSIDIERAGLLQALAHFLNSAIDFVDGGGV